MFRNADPIYSPPYWDTLEVRARYALTGTQFEKEQQEMVKKWEAQAQEGSARAAGLAGEGLWVKEGLHGCKRAEAMLRRALELGAREAPYLLGVYFAEADCTKRRRDEAKAWFEQAVELGDGRAYGYLLRGFEERGESVTEVAARERRLVAEARARVPTDGALLAQPVETTMPANAAPGWSYKVERVDHTRQCALNTANNCRGVPFIVRYALTNSSERYLACKIKVAVPALERTAVIAPNATREVVLGEIDTEIPAGAATAECSPLEPDPLAAGAATCVPKLASSLSADEHYPLVARRNGFGGRVVVRALVARTGEQPLDVELVTSSSYPVLDEAALQAIRTPRFTADCQNALITLAIKFDMSR